MSLVLREGSRTNAVNCRVLPRRLPSMRPRYVDVRAAMPDRHWPGAQGRAAGGGLHDGLPNIEALGLTISPRADAPRLQQPLVCGPDVGDTVAVAQDDLAADVASSHGGDARAVPRQR